jgi:hypothetical protein
LGAQLKAASNSMQQYENSVEATAKAYEQLESAKDKAEKNDRNAQAKVIEL